MKKIITLLLISLLLLSACDDNESSINTSTEASAEISAEASIDSSAEASAEVSIEASNETSAETSTAEISTDVSINTSTEVSADVSMDTSNETSDNIGETDSDESKTEVPKECPDELELKVDINGTETEFVYIPEYQASGIYASANTVQNHMETYEKSEYEAAFCLIKITDIDFSTLETGIMQIMPYTVEIVDIYDSTSFSNIEKGEVFKAADSSRWGFCSGDVPAFNIKKGDLNYANHHFTFPMLNKNCYQIALVLKYTEKSRQRFEDTFMPEEVKLYVYCLSIPIPEICMNDGYADIKESYVQSCYNVFKELPKETREMSEYFIDKYLNKK